MPWAFKLVRHFTSANMERRKEVRTDDFVRTKLSRITKFSYPWCFTARLARARAPHNNTQHKKECFVRISNTQSYRILLEKHDAADSNSGDLHFFLSVSRLITHCIHKSIRSCCS